MVEENIQDNKSLLIKIAVGSISGFLGGAYFYKFYKGD